MIRVAVIGPGRLGTALALALPTPAYEVVAVAGRSARSVEAFLTAVPGAVPLEPVAAARAADLVLVTVPDDRLAPVVREPAAADAVVEGSRWVHCAGRHDHTVLRPAALAGARTAACHPAQTVSDPQLGAAALVGASWAVTAEAADLGWARVLVTDLRGTPVTVRPQDRTRYHAGLVVGANGTSSVVTLARELLLGAGVRDPGQFLGPLTTEAAANAAERGAAALTGPVRRGDAGTVQAHLDSLAVALPEAAEAYVALARLALSQARRAGLDPEAADAVAERLDEQSPAR